MGMQLTTPESEIQAYIEAQVERINMALLYNLQYVGERCLNAARSTNSYKDRTGNLRSSLGYVLVRDGAIFTQSDFAAVSNASTQGPKSGQQLAEELVKRAPKGLVLIVVAGMNYAQYVASKGYDVLDSAELLAERLVPQILKQIGLS